MKNLKHLFTTLLLLCCTYATAQTYEIDGIFYKITSDTDKTVGVAKSTAYKGNVVIPESISFKPYNNIRLGYDSGPGTYKQSYILNISPGNTLKFDWKVNSLYTDYLTIKLNGDIIISKSNLVEGSYEKTFDTTTSITLDVEFKRSYSASAGHAGYVENIYISGGEVIDAVTYSVTSIEKEAFKGCTAIRSVDMPNSITSIGESAFSGCTGLGKVKLSNAITTINKSTFNGCTVLSDINLPDRVTSIGESAFQGCTALNSINLPDGLTSIGVSAFQGCTTLSNINLPDGLTSIGASAFKNCLLLKNISIPNGVTTLEKNTFLGCTSLTNIALNTITTINDSVFINCQNLESLSIPANVTTIGNAVFNNCVSLSKLTFEDGTTAIKLGYKFYNSSSSYGGSGLFRDCPLDTLYIGRDISSYQTSESYGYSPFAYIESLKNVTIGAPVTTLYTNLFYNCSSLTEISIPGNVTKINGGVFNGCKLLKNVRFENSETSISLGAHTSMPSYTSSRGYGLFYDCPIENVYIGRNIEYTSTEQNGYSPFYSKSSLKELTLGSNVANIGNYMFCYSSNITEAKSYSFTAPTLSTTSPFSTKPETATLWVPYGSDYSGYEKYFTIKYFSYIAEFFIDGEKFSEAEVNYGEAIELPTAPEKEGYTFQGWEGVPETMPAKDVQIHGSYKVNNYTVTYIVDGEVYNTTSHTYGTAVTPIEAPAKEGYTFSHWEGMPSIMPANDVEVVAVYNRIPTEVTITISEYGCGTFCSEYALDFTAVTGLKAYAAGGYNTSNGIVTVFQVNTTPAGTGLFIKGEPGSYEVPVIKESFDQTVNLLVGTLEKTNVNATSDDNLYANFKFTIKPEDDEPMFYRFADESTLGAGKAYLQIPLSWLPSAQQRTIGIRFGNNGTTDICETIDESQEVVYYDLSGRKVTNPTRGIYIVNGKKVFIK